jgi:hypothetical protein
MLFERSDGLWIGRFGRLLSDQRFIHGFGTRTGGVSRGPYESLNAGTHTNDAPDAVEENRRRFFRAVGMEADRLVAPRQVHGDRVHTAEEPGTVPDTDAAITGRPGLILSVQVADCAAVFLVDAKRRAAGLAHAGWRGTAFQIASKTVQAMTDVFGCNPCDLIAFLGPSIGPCCFTVGSETSGQFHPKYVRDGKLDLWQCNTDQLLQLGLKPERVVSSRLCTACHPEWFYSHRKSGGKTGRMLAVLGIRE